MKILDINLGYTVDHKKLFPGLIWKGSFHRLNHILLYNLHGFCDVARLCCYSLLGNGDVYRPVCEVGCDPSGTPPG